MAKIHCSPVHQVTYGDGYFSGYTAEINRLLKENSRNLHYDGDDIDSAERLEVPRVDLVALIAKITNDMRKFDEWLAKRGLHCTPLQFIGILCDWVANSDQRNDYVVLTWI